MATKKNYLGKNRKKILFFRVIYHSILKFVLPFILNYFLNSFWREEMLFLVDALANAKSLFSANFLAFPAVADATLGLLSKMANLALTNP